MEENGCITALNASNSRVVTYNGSNREVKTVDFDQIDLAAEKIKLFVVAKNSDNQVIWSFDVGVIPKGTGIYSLNVSKGDKYVYYVFGGELEARDIQTGKIIWKNEMNEELPSTQLIEYKDKLFILSGMPETNMLHVIDVNDGKVISKNEDIYTIYNNADTNYYLDSKDVIKENNNIIIKVIDYDDNDNEIIKGKLVINYNDYSVKFEK